MQTCFRRPRRTADAVVQTALLPRDNVASSSAPAASVLGGMRSGVWVLGWLRLVAALRCRL
eukprot:6894474-Alexandrium_andersonii.AAC.1